MLDLENNILEEFGMHGEVRLADELPHLRLINLSNNRGLVKIQPLLLQGAQDRLMDLTIKAENCNLYTPVLTALVEIANFEKVKLII